jgi:RNA polymerase sigma-70 factor (ECF subfamily)
MREAVRRPDGTGPGDAAEGAAHPDPPPAAAGGAAPAVDAALLAAYAAGDAAAARALTLRLAPRLIAAAARLLGDRTEAEDVAQETLLRLWRAAADWPVRVPPEAWARRVAVNLCLDRLRRRPTAPLEAAHAVTDPAPTAAAALEAADRAAAVAAALAALPDRQRAAVALRHFEGRSNPDIAAALGVGVEAVESLLARGRRALARALGPGEAEGESR